MKNILIPTDFSENSWNAIKYALQFFKNTSSNFYFLHINSLTDLVGAEATYIPTQDAIKDVFTTPSRKGLKNILDRIEDKFPPNNKHKFFKLIDFNFFIDSIRKHVDEKKIDIIVMGTKGASGLKKIIIGSNTGDVITKVKCTTLVVPENAEYESPKEIAFPTEYSFFYSPETLQPLSEIVEIHKSAVRILHINKLRAVLNENQLANKYYLNDYFQNYKHSFHFLTNTKIEEAIQCFVESRDINLIAMVAKNLNYFQKIFFSPKVKEIGYHTDIPFLVLHE